MRLSWKNAEWRRVLLIYALYALLLSSWKFCVPSFRTIFTFEWFSRSSYLYSPKIPGIMAIAGIEFICTLIVAAFVSLKPQQVSKESDSSNRDFLNTVGVIIPCHKSKDVIKATLESVLHHFCPEHVVVMDNGSSRTPLDTCLLMIRHVSLEVIYRWVPVGHKATALLLGSRLLPPTVKYVLLIDDDVHIPKFMNFDFSYFEDEQVSAVAFSIAGYGPDLTVRSMNSVQCLADFEYKLFDTSRAFFSQYGTVLFAHGAVGLWRRERFTAIYENHPGLPIGEDQWAGRINLMSGHTMKHDSGPLIYTETPSNLIPKQWCLWSSFIRNLTIWRKDKHVQDGEHQTTVAGFGSADLFNQRARRWYMNSPRRIWCNSKLFLTYGWGQFRKLPLHKALVFNVLFRFKLLRGTWTHLKVFAYITALANFFSCPARCSQLLELLQMFLVVYSVSVGRYILINFFVWRNRKDLQVTVTTMLCMPFYRKVISIYCCYGWLRSVLKYIPIIKSPEKVLGEREDVKVIWDLLRDQTDDDYLHYLEHGDYIGEPWPLLGVHTSDDFHCRRRKIV